MRVEFLYKSCDWVSKSIKFLPSNPQVIHCNEEITNRTDEKRICMLYLFKLKINSQSTEVIDGIEKILYLIIARARARARVCVCVCVCVCV